MIKNDLGESMPDSKVFKKNTKNIHNLDEELDLNVENMNLPGIKKKITVLSIEDNEPKSNLHLQRTRPGTSKSHAYGIQKNNLNRSSKTVSKENLSALVEPENSHTSKITEHENRKATQDSLDSISVVNVLSATGDFTDNEKINSDRSNNKSLSDLREATTSKASKTPHMLKPRQIKYRAKSAPIYPIPLEKIHQGYFNNS
jgi:hypothetical protein